MMLSKKKKKYNRTNKIKYGGSSFPMASTPVKATEPLTPLKVEEKIESTNLYEPKKIISSKIVSDKEIMANDQYKIDEYFQIFIEKNEEKIKVFAKLDKDKKLSYFKEYRSNDKEKKQPLIFVIAYILNKKIDLFLNIIKDISKKKILSIKNSNKIDIIHSACLHGLYNIFYEFNNSLELDEELRDNKDKNNRNYIHYILKSKSKYSSKILSLILNNNSVSEYIIQNENSDDTYCKYLLDNSISKNNIITLKQLQILIYEYDFLPPIGEDFINNNKEDIYRNLYDFLMEKENKLIMLNSHFNDNTENYYQCPKTLKKSSIDDSIIEFFNDEEEKEEPEKLKLSKNILGYNSKEDLFSSNNPEVIHKNSYYKILESSDKYKKISVNLKTKYIFNKDLE